MWLEVANEFKCHCGEMQVADVLAFPFGKKNKISGLFTTNTNLQMIHFLGCPKTN